MGRRRTCPPSICNIKFCQFEIERTKKNEAYTNHRIIIFQWTMNTGDTGNRKRPEVVGRKQTALQRLRIIITENRVGRH